MMKKHVFKHVMNKAYQEMEDISFGYEMDCLISAEFTPAPDFNMGDFLTKELSKYGYTLGEFVLWLESQANKWDENYEGYSYNPYVDLLFLIPGRDVDCLSVSKEGEITVYEI